MYALNTPILLYIVYVDVTLSTKIFFISVTEQLLNVKVCIIQETHVDRHMMILDVLKL